MTWAQRLKRVFRIDIDKSAGHRDVPDDTCEYCGGDSA
jgi:hypothetical protein